MFLWLTHDDLILEANLLIRLECMARVFGQILNETRPSTNVFDMFERSNAIESIGYRKIKEKLAFCNRCLTQPLVCKIDK